MVFEKSCVTKAKFKISQLYFLQFISFTHIICHHVCTLMSFQTCFDVFCETQKEEFSVCSYCSSPDKERAVNVLHMTGVIYLKPFGRCRVSNKSNIQVPTDSKSSLLLLYYTFRSVVSDVSGQ